MNRICADGFQTLAGKERVETDAEVMKLGLGNGVLVEAGVNLRAAPGHIDELLADAAQSGGGLAAQSELAAFEEQANFARQFGGHLLDGVLDVFDERVLFAR